MRYITKNDIESCINFMEHVKDDFAGYKEEEFLQALQNAQEQKEALITNTDNGDVAGLLIFSKGAKELGFLAVHPACRQKGIAKELIEGMKSHFSKGEEIHVITFQEGDPKGISARKCYFSSGFVDTEKVIVFEYPCQKMVCVI